MKNDKNIFSDEYITQSTESSQIQKEKEIKESLSQIKIDIKSYGLNKPKRKILKAKIIHD